MTATFRTPSLLTIHFADMDKNGKIILIRYHFEVIAEIHSFHAL